MRRRQLAQPVERRAGRFVRPVPIFEQEADRVLTRCMREQRGERVEHGRLEVLALEMPRQRIALRRIASSAQ